MKVIFTMALFQTIFLATTGDIDVEDLVDDFTTFYVAGKLADLNNFVTVVH